MILNSPSDHIQLLCFRTEKMEKNTRLLKDESGCQMVWRKAELRSVLLGNYCQMLFLIVQYILLLHRMAVIILSCVRSFISGWQMCASYIVFFCGLLHYYYYYYMCNLDQMKWTVGCYYYLVYWSCLCTSLHIITVSYCCVFCMDNKYEYLH